MKSFQIKCTRSFLSIWLIAIICLSISTISFANKSKQDTIIYDISTLDNEPVFLYNYLKIHTHNKVDKITHADSIENLIYHNNQSKVGYNLHEDVSVKLEIKNNSQDTIVATLNFSPNNWNQSWDQIIVKGFIDEQLVLNVNTGNNYNSSDKPVHSVMNLLDIQVPPHGSHTIYVHLKGIIESDTNTPNYIDFVLSQRSQSAGLRADYGFEGEYINRKAHAAFRANHLINHEIFLDNTTSKSIQEIDERWTSLKTSDIFNTKYDPESVYWLKTRLLGSPEFNGKQIFQVSNTPYWGRGSYAPVAENFSFDYIDGFYKNTNGTYVHQRSGYKVSTAERPLKFWANFLTVEVAIGDTIDYYIRLEGGHRRQYMTSLTLYHVDPWSIFPRQVNEGWSHGLYYGALGIYLFFFTLLYIVEKERLYLYFSISILGLLMINIFPEDIFIRYVVFPTWRAFHIPFYFLGTFVLFFGFSKFTEKYFLIDKSSLISRIIIPGHIILLGMGALYCTFRYEYLPVIGNPIFQPYMLAFLFLQLISILLPIIIALFAKKKQGVSKVSYFISFAPLIVAGLYHFGKLFLPNFLNIESFQSTGEVEQSFNFIQLGVAAMLTLFAMNVGLKANGLKSEKERALLLEEKNVIIEAKSKQNETLLKEIHHRVKNNLQTISSLLYLQSYGEKNEQTKENIAITQQRVESMALIHKNLYQRDNLAAIEMKDYIRNLCESLIASYQSKGTTLELHLEMLAFELNIDRAIPMGLIINEIVTNALKYAFPDQERGTIHISLDRNEAGCHSLRISDNGIGMPEDMKPSFGSQLIKLLSKQINLTVESGNDNGYWTSLTWEDPVISQSSSFVSGQVDF